MSHYESFADADEMPVLETQPLDLTAEETQTIRDLAAYLPIAVRAAHVYDRKGYFTTDDFAGHQNPSYRGKHDDIVVQVTMVLRPSTDLAEQGQYDQATGIYDRIRADKAAAEIAARQAEVAQAEADLAAAQARLDALRSN